MSLNLHVLERYFHLLALRGSECPGALRVPNGGGGFHITGNCDNSVNSNSANPPPWSLNHHSHHYLL